MPPHASIRNHNPAPFTDPTCSEDAILFQAPASHQLTFIDGQQDKVSRLSAGAAAKHRHAIFTETERQHMSDQVIQSVPDQDPTQALLHLERFDDPGIDTIAPLSHFYGPFGVSKLLPHGTYTEPISQGNAEALLSAEDWLTGLDEPIEQDPNTADLLSSLLDAPDDIPNVGSEIWDLVSSGKSPPCPPLDPLAQISPNYFTKNAEAWCILSHYRDRIGPLILPFGQGQETSWMKLVMPCAVQALGELTMDGSSTHARLALLNAVLSTSSFHLGNTNSSTSGAEYWRPVGNDYLQRAQHHLIRCLEDAYASATKRSKYKEILMAVLSLSTAYVGRRREMSDRANMSCLVLEMVKGDLEKRRSCLLQAERFICANGFKHSTLSLKRRALHHCYAYMRIMAETTNIADGLSVDAPSASSILDAEDSANGDFRISSDVIFSENILDIEKDPSVAQRDLHLAIPGRWSLTLFPKMYGVAERFLMLLSQVIRLANERDLSMLRGRREGMLLSLRDFWIRAKALEKRVHLLLSSCAPAHDPSTISEEEDTSPQTEITNPRARAMYTALLIFFHRRVYDLDAAMLQHEVSAVRDALIQSQQNKASNGDGNPAALIWPAFIAACEAVSSEAQMFFSSWFDACFTVTGLASASTAKQVSVMTRAEKRELGRDGECRSWPEVLRARNIRLVCT